MKASELIAKLQELIEINGDLEVEHVGQCGGVEYDIESISLEGEVFCIY